MTKRNRTERPAVCRRNRILGVTPCHLPVKTRALRPYHTFFNRRLGAVPNPYGDDRAMATATATKSKVKFRPMDDRILIEVCDAEETTSGGIILPDSAREKPQRGVVRAVGPGKLLDSGKRGDIGVKVGDELFYGKYAGTEIEFGTDKYTVLRENDILAIITK